MGGWTLPAWSPRALKKPVGLMWLAQWAAESRFLNAWINFINIDINCELFDGWII